MAAASDLLGCQPPPSALKAVTAAPFVEQRADGVGRAASEVAPHALDGGLEALGEQRVGGGADVLELDAGAARAASGSAGLG
jgi:hypothetical protein